MLEKGQFLPHQDKMTLPCLGVKQAKLTSLFGSTGSPNLQQVMSNIKNAGAPTRMEPNITTIDLGFCIE